MTSPSMPRRPAFGALPVTDAEIERVIRSGVHVFLLAYGPHR